MPITCLDVETSACTMSSRIVLANSSIQLFVQRHLMNLEVEALTWMLTVGHG
jgi:hypothetical protein